MSTYSFIIAVALGGSVRRDGFRMDLAGGADARGGERLRLRPADRSGERSRRRRIGSGLARGLGRGAWASSRGERRARAAPSVVVERSRAAPPDSTPPRPGRERAGQRSAAGTAAD